MNNFYPGYKIFVFGKSYFYSWQPNPKPKQDENIPPVRVVFSGEKFTFLWLYFLLSTLQKRLILS